MSAVDEIREQRIADEIREQAASISVLSEVMLADEDLEYLRTNAQRIIIKGFMNNENGKILCAFLLVDIGIRKYDEGDYWSHVQSETGAMSRKDQVDLYATFSEVLELLNLSSGPDTKRSLEKVLMHTFVPDKYLDGFYDFVCKTYTKILGYTIDDIDSYSDRLAEFMELSGSVDKADQDMPNPSSLKMCTRYALKDTKLSGPILKKIIRLIHAGYHGEAYNDVSLHRFTESFQKWYKRNIGMRSRRSLIEEMRNRKPLLTFDASKNSVSLKLPILKCSRNAQLSIKVGKEEITPQEQPQIISSPGKENMMSIGKTFSLKSLKISPFQEFRVVFDNIIILRNSAKPYKFFREGGTESKGLSEGINYLIIDKESEGPKSYHGSVITSLGDNAYEISVPQGGAIGIFGELFNIKEEGIDVDSVLVHEVQNVFAETPEGEIIPITDRKEISFTMNTSGKQVLPIIKIKDANGQVHVPVPREKQSVNDSISAFTHELADDMGVHEYEVFLTESEKMRCKQKFLFIPGFKHSFDTEGLHYETQKTGTLTTVLEEQPIHFNTNLDEIVRPLLISDKKYNIIYRVPVLSILVEEGKWRYPGTFDITSREMVNDTIKIKSIAAFLMRLSSTHEKSAIEFIQRKDEAFVFSTVGLKNLINNNPGGEYVLELSVNSKPRKKLLRIITHNDYDIIEADGISVSMKRNLNVTSTFKVMKKGKCIASGQIIEGMNQILTQLQGRVEVSIFEEDNSSLVEGSERLVLQKYFGNPLDSEKTEEGFKIFYNEKVLNLTCSTCNYDDIKKRLGEVKPFNKWIIGQEEKILNHLKQQYGLNENK